jgi:methylase of polypeptide subunit release factors
MSAKQPPSPTPDHAWAKSAAKKAHAAKLTAKQIQSLIHRWLSPSDQTSDPKAQTLSAPPSLAALARFHELAHPNRSDHGVYYTPPAAAALMAQAALSQWQSAHPHASTQNLTILDPAAGTGDLLLAARDFLPRNFTGRLIAIDTDRAALEIARARLLENHPHLADHITLITGSGLSPTLTKNIGQADILLLNPPYVPAYSRRSRKTKVLSVKQKKQKSPGRVNLFTRFIHAIQTLTKPTGVACTITPDTLAFADSYAPDRAELAKRFPSQRWLLIEKPLFDAAVQNVIGLFSQGECQTQSAQANHVPASADAATWIPGPPPSSSPVIFYKHPAEPLVQSTINKVHGTLLSDFFQVKDGINPGPAHMRAKLISPLKPDVHTTRSQCLPPTQSPLLTGRDIAPWGFCITHPTLAIRYDPSLVSRAEQKTGCSLRNPGIFQSPKLVSRQTANMPIVGIDLDQNHYTSNSVHNIRAIEPAHTPLLWGLMAYLNSPVTRLYYALSGGETRATLPQVRIAWLSRLPLPPGWQTLFAALGPLAQSLAQQAKPDPGTLTQIHHIICAHLNLPDPAAISAAYQTRFNKPSCRVG